MTIYLDCDGTWINLYGVENWLDYLLAEDVYPYANAKPLVNLSLLARTIHELQRKGVKVGIISWLSKGGSETYNAAVDIKYGTPKSTCATQANAILFDDEEKNRAEWKGKAFDEKNLIKILRAILSALD